MAKDVSIFDGTAWVSIVGPPGADGVDGVGALQRLQRDWHPCTHAGVCGDLRVVLEHKPDHNVVMRRKYAS